MAFLYFGYGSNMDATSLAAKGVRPAAGSRPARLDGWRLRFNVAHFFDHEGGVGNIERHADGVVWGVLHTCEDDALEALDRAELYPHGYGRLSLPVTTADGTKHEALAYVGMPAFLDERCRPTRRYLAILVQGARAMGLPADYVDALRAEPVHVNPEPPPFVPPPGDWPDLPEHELAARPEYTALDGHVWDMREARWQHRLLWPWFGGRDMTLFHLRRMHDSDGREDEALVRAGAYSAAQRRYLDEYLHAYAREYRYVGRLAGTTIQPEERQTMDDFPGAQPHGPLEEVFPDVFFVTGTMKTQLMGAHWHFSRNMTVVRDRGGDGGDGDVLTLINSVRLDDDGLAALERLGTVRHVVRIGSLHGLDDDFYRHRYAATTWALPGMPGATPDRELVAGAGGPCAGSSVFAFEKTKLPEAILHLDREGGILVAADALQHWVAPDAFFSDESRQAMTQMGFFQPANFGPVWMKVNEPQRDDFDRLLALRFRHVLPGHGSALRDGAHAAYAARAAQVFGA